jgi:hypothetical protein
LAKCRKCKNHRKARKSSFSLDAMKRKTKYMEN